MGNVKSTLTATVTAVDVNSQQPITRQFSAQLDSAFGQLTAYDVLLVAATEYTISLPETPVYCIYVKNNDAANNCQVKWTPNGGAEVIVVNLRPNGFICYWNPTAGTGITSLKLTPAGNTLPVEYYLGA